MTQAGFMFEDPIIEASTGNYAAEAACKLLNIGQRVAFSYGCSDGTVRQLIGVITGKLVDRVDIDTDDPIHLHWRCYANSVEVI